jgi:aromatic amino acid aminotransferase I
MAPPTAIDIEGVTDTQAIVLPDPLTVNGVSARRAKAGKFSYGTAAFTSSDFFKSLVSISPRSTDFLLMPSDLSKAKSQKMGS